MGRVFVTRRLPGDALDRLGQVHEVRVYEGSGPVPREVLLEAAAEADALVTMLTDRVDEAVLARGVKVVANCAVGYDNVDLEAARRHGVVVTHTPDVLTEATADLAFALLLAAARRVVEGDRLVRRGVFPPWNPHFLLGRAVSGRVLGVVGPGRIGRAVLRRGRGFGMTLLYHGRRPLPPSVEAELGARRMPFDDLLATSDFVSLHVPLTPETHHLVDAAALSRMKRTAVLVNTARGPVVDEAALAEALAEGRLFAAGLDVFEAEPAVHPALLEAPNVVLTPHVGSATWRARVEMARLCAEAVEAVLGGRKVAHAVVDPR